MSLFPVNIDTKNKAEVEAFVNTHGVLKNSGVDPKSEHALFYTIRHLRKKENLPHYRAVENLHPDFGYSVMDGELPTNLCVTYAKQQRAKEVAQLLNLGQTPPEDCIEDHVPQTELIFLANEKHGDRYFVIHDWSEMLDVAWKLFLERNAQGYYNYPDAETEKPELTLEQVEALPEGRTKTAARQEYQSWQRRQEELKAQNTEKTKYDGIISAGKEPTLVNKLRAVTLLRLRKNGEYEGYELVKPESPSETDED